jgi:hypothetical protein
MEVSCQLHALTALTLKYRLTMRLGESYFWFGRCGQGKIFNLRNSSSRTMTLRSTQLLNRKEYQVSSWGVKGGRRVKDGNLTFICEPIVQKTWEPRRLKILRVLTACYRDSFTFTFISPLGLEPQSLGRPARSLVSLPTTGRSRLPLRNEG